MTHQGTIHESGVRMSPYASKIYNLMKDFVENECIPVEHIYHSQIGQGENRWKVNPPILKTLQQKARNLGLWNLFLTEEYGDLSPGLTTMEYAVICEVIGRCPEIASAATNCAAPDTGNMEVLAKYGTKAQKEKWLKPLMEAKIRSAFAMTEPDVASSDATNICTKITKTPDGKHYIINGRKHWISNSSNPDCRVYVLVGQTDSSAAKHARQSVILVPKYQDEAATIMTPGITIVRHLHVMGYDDAPHGHDEILFENVKVPVENLVLGEGRGFEVLQGRLGGGRIHHCMRSLGVANRAYELMLLEATNPKKRPFGKLKGEQGKVQWDIAQCRVDLEMMRRLVYYAAGAMDSKGFKEARNEIAMAKIAVPTMALNIIDRAMQVYGGLGLSQSTSLAAMWAHQRTLRFADGPDEAHASQLARSELGRADALRRQFSGYETRAKELQSKL